MCFNHQFISEEEFTKLFKVVIHGMGFKESLFRDLLKKNVNTSLDDD